MNHLARRSHRQYSSPGQPPVAKPDYPLEIYTLGRFTVCREGRQVVPEGRGQRKPLELLKALIAMGGRGVEERRLIFRLWPDAVGDAAYRAFITTLRRLRQSLGFRDAVILKDGCLTLNPALVWVDCWAFERLLGETESAAEEGDSIKAAILCEEALRLYTGRFLERDAEHPWVMGISERLHRKFARHVERRGRCLEDAGEWDAASECYQKALDVDCLAEVFYQGLMRCYIRMGRPSDAINVYMCCRKALLINLGIPPAPATEALHQGCRKNTHLLPE